MDGLIRRYGNRHPLLADALLGLATCVSAAAGIARGTHDTPGHPPRLGDVIAMVIAFAAITLRRRWPRTIMVLTTVASTGYVLVTSDGHPVLIVAVGVAAYTMASRTDRRSAWLLAGVCALIFYVGAAISTGVAFVPRNVPPVLAYFGMVTAFGDATRSRREYLAGVEERARRAEQTREEEAQRRVIGERLRIARELHDVIAHHIAVINVQAGAASHLIDRRPDQVKPALAHIRSAGDTVLRELASIIGVLRESDDPDIPTEPTRGLPRLPELLDQSAAAGLTVEFHREGEPRTLPAVADLAAYRIVQEALTNAQKHGTGRATLTLRYDPDEVVIEVVNAAGAKRDTTGGGYGIVGMRERATAAEGTLDTYTDDQGRFTVRAKLPAWEPAPTDQLKEAL